MKAINTIRSLWLEVKDNAVAVSKVTEQSFISLVQRRQYAQKQSSTLLSDSDFDIANMLSVRQPRNQFTHRQQQRRDMGRQYGTTPNIRDVAATPLMKANQHFTIFCDLANGKTGAMAISPRLPLDRRQYRFRANAANVPKTVLKHALLGSKLGRRIHVLHRTTATYAKMRAPWFNTGVRWLEDAHQVRQFKLRFSPETGILDRFARQRAINKYGLSIQTCDSPRLMVQRCNDPDWHGQLQKSANFINQLH
jgi:hypothetical protein